MPRTTDNSTSLPSSCSASAPPLARFPCFIPTTTALRGAQVHTYVPTKVRGTSPTGTFPADNIPRVRLPVRGNSLGLTILYYQRPDTILATQRKRAYYTTTLIVCSIVSISLEALGTGKECFYHWHGFSAASENCDSMFNFIAHFVSTFSPLEVDTSFPVIRRARPRRAYDVCLFGRLQWADNVLSPSVSAAHIRTLEK